MMCLNTDSPEYKRLIENTDAHPFEVFVKVNAWFKNNPDATDYPTLQQIGVKPKTVVAKQSNIFNETLSLLNEDGHIDGYTDKVVMYNGINFSIEQFFISNYGATMNSNGNVTINAKQYFANRPSKFRQIKNALNINNDSVIFSLFDNYVNNATNPISKAGDTDGFIEYASMQQEPIQIQQARSQQQQAEPIRLVKPLTPEKTNILQSKIDRAFFNKLVESRRYQVSDMTVDYENTRDLEYGDFEKLMSGKLELELSKNGYITDVREESRAMFEEYIYKADNTDHEYFIDDIKSFFESYYNPELPANEISAFEKRIDALAKLVPEMANFKSRSTLGQLELFDSNEGMQQQVKPGVEELFDSNPGLANKVYQALGFVGDLNKLGVQDIKTYVGDKLTTVEDTAKSLISMILDGTYDEFTDAELTSFEKSVYIYSIERMSKNMYFNRYVAEVMEPYDDGYVEEEFSDDLKKKYNIRARTEFDVYEEFLKYKKEFSIDPNEVVRIFNIGNGAIADKIALKLYIALLSEQEGYSGLPDNLVELELQKVTPEQKQQALQLYSQYLNTIFPNSKVKDIVYHGTGRSEKTFEKRIPDKEYGANAIYFANEAYAKTFGNLIPAILNITNPFTSEKKFMRRKLKPGYGSPQGTIDAKDLLSQNKNNDGLIGVDYSDQENNTYVVREPEQIHILGSKQDIEGFKQFVNKPTNNNSLFGLDTQNEEQLKFHINTLNVISKFLENIGVEERLVPEFLSEDGSVIEGAIAAANFVEGTVDIIDDLNKGRAQAWNKLPEEAAHWWYRLLKENSPLKKALWESHKVALKNDELYAGKYGKLVKSPSDLTEESIGQLIAEAIKRIEAKKGNPSDYSFFKKFLEWINSIIDVFKKTKIDPFEVAAMKILSSDTSDLMTLEEYRRLNNIVNFADVLTDQSVIPVDYTLLEDIDQINYSVIYDEETNSEVELFYFADSPFFSTKEELDNWVTKKYGNLLTKRQKQKIVEVRDNQIFFDRLLNKTFRKKSKFLPKTLKKYYDIIDSKTIKSLKNWSISMDSNITKKLSDQEKQQLIQTNGYTNIAPTLKVLPNLLQKYKKTPIVLSQPIKIDGAKKQELSILNGIREMIKLENPGLKSITAEEFVDEAHNWLQVNYMLGFADEKGYLSYRTDQTFEHLNDRKTDQDIDIANMTEEELQRLPFEERQRIANMLGLTKKNPDVYHNKVSLRFNDNYHVKSSHFTKSPSAWGNLTYFYTGKNKWKDAVLIHEIQNDNIEYLRDFKSEQMDLESSLNMYLQELNSDLIENIKQIESDSKYVYKRESWETFGIKKTHKHLNHQLEAIRDLPLEQGLDQLKGSLDELIDLHESNYGNDLAKAEAVLDKAYSQKRIFQDLQTRGGIKSLLTKEELNDLQEILRGLNRQEETTEGDVYDEQGFPFIGYDPRYRSLSDRKREFEILANPITEKINKEFKRLYGKNAPTIILQATGKTRTRSELRRGVEKSNELNENVNFLLAFSENKVTKRIHKDIFLSKKGWIVAKKADTRYRFNVALSKITLEQYATLIENYKYNQDLLNRLIDEQSKKDLNQQTNDYNILEELKSTIYYSPGKKEWVMALHELRFEYLPKGLRKEFKSNISKEDVAKDFETYFNNWKKNNNINSYKEILMLKQKEDFEALKQEALDKKAELEKKYDKIEEEVKQTLEIEMNYFTPLVHHLIQKHINQYGKDFPMYLIGFNAGKLTQGNRGKAILSAALYAGKEESNLLSKEEIINLKLKAANYLGVIPDTKNTPENIEKIKAYENTKPKNTDDITNKQNLQLSMISLNGDKPFQTGIIHNLFSQISGVKLIWQGKIDGLKNNTGGYLVDLSNYNYNVPILYGLSDNQNTKEAKQPTEKSKNIDPSNLKQIEHQILAYLAENPDATYDGALEALVRSGDLNLDCSM